MTPTAGSAQTSPSQTLSRGIRALEILADAQHPLTIAELAEAMGVHRSVAYRILRTLEDHSLLVRDDGGRVQPGPGLAVLARGVSRNLQTAALPGADPARQRPDHERVRGRVGPPGMRHPGHRGSAAHRGRRGPASRFPAPDQRRRPRHRHPVGAGGTRMGGGRARHPLPGRGAEARRRGYAASHDEVIAGVSSVAAPVRVPGGRPGRTRRRLHPGRPGPGEVAAALAEAAGADRGPAGLTPPGGR